MSPYGIPTARVRLGQAARSARAVGMPCGEEIVCREGIATDNSGILWYNEKSIYPVREPTVIYTYILKYGYINKRARTFYSSLL